jgi:hypothetical protein
MRQPLRVLIESTLVSGMARSQQKSGDRLLFDMVSVLRAIFSGDLLNG